MSHPPKSYEILLGNNLPQQTKEAFQGSQRYFTLQRRGEGIYEGGDSKYIIERKEKMKSNPEKWHFSTLPRKVKKHFLNYQILSKIIFSIIHFPLFKCFCHYKLRTSFSALAINAMEASEADDDQDQPNCDGSPTKLPKSSSTSARMGAMPVLPPPASFKSVHFALSTVSDDCNTVIPTEGLPSGPACLKNELKS